MRTAHVAHPELKELSVYARCNLAEDGSLKVGDEWPNVNLWTLGGKQKGLKEMAGDLTVICSGSWT